jgi:predicted Zn-dependent protease
VINSGAVSVAESEAELAAVLCHEIAHENSCDGQTPGREGNFFELICSAPTVVLGGPAGIAITAGAAWAAAGERARVIRAQEERADRLAAQYLVRAGYDPHAVAQFFRRVEAEEPRSGAETGRLLATHPRPNDRRSKLDKVTADLPFQAVAPHDETEFLHMRQAVRDYDDMYSRLVNIRLPGRDAPVPVLSRRPSSVAEGPRP